MTPTLSLGDRLQHLALGWLERADQWLPHVLGALALLLLGWLAGWLLSALSLRLLNAVDATLVRVLGPARAARLRLARSAPLIGRAVFWAVQLVFAAAAVQTLGLPAVAQWLQPLLDQLPNVLAGVVIIGAGVLVARVVAELVLNAPGPMAPAQRQVLGRAAQATIVAAALLIGAEQMGIRVTFVAIFAGALALALAGGAVVAVSLGARVHVANLIAMQQLRPRLQPGQRIRIAGYEGRVLQFHADTLLIETAAGRVSLPGQLFSREALLQLAETEAHD